MTLQNRSEKVVFEKTTHQRLHNGANGGGDVAHDSSHKRLILGFGHDADQWLSA